MKHKRFMILCSLIGFLAVLTAAEDPRRQKMCWAHYVGWGFNQTDGYDLAMRSPGSWRLSETGRCWGKTSNGIPAFSSAPASRLKRRSPTGWTASAWTSSIRTAMSAA